MQTWSHDQATGMPEQRAGTGPALQSKCPNKSASSMCGDARTPMDVVQEENELSAEVAMEISLPYLGKG